MYRFIILSDNSKVFIKTLHAALVISGFDYSRVRLRGRLENKDENLINLGL